MSADRTIILFDEEFHRKHPNAKWWDVLTADQAEALARKHEAFAENIRDALRW